MKWLLTARGGLICEQPEGHDPGVPIVCIFDHEPTREEISTALGEVALEIARATAEERLSAACRATIIGGFTSDALGSPHTYPCGETDQINLMGLVSAAQISGPGWTCNFACADQTGVWAHRPHTGEQITEVGLAGVDHKIAALARIDARRTSIAAALSIGEINAISWED